MKKRLFTIIISLSIISCQQTKKEKAFKIFNEGVTLSLNAGTEANRGNEKKAIELNDKAIEKFRETLRTDSTHSIARSALAHSLYISKKYDEAIEWFKKANAIGKAEAVNYMELGLSQINLGQTAEGEKNLFKALELDKSEEIREITVEDLYDIGKLAFKYGDAYKKEGKTEKALTYKQFSIDVLKLSLKINPARADIRSTADSCAKQLMD
jgi:tetratricopeptide (TPR) repeat protein